MVPWTHRCRNPQPKLHLDCSSLVCQYVIKLNLIIFCDCVTGLDYCCALDDLVIVACDGDWQPSWSISQQHYRGRVRHVRDWPGLSLCPGCRPGGPRMRQSQLWIPATAAGVSVWRCREGELWVTWLVEIGIATLVLLPSVLWRCWLGGRKGIRQP